MGYQEMLLTFAIIIILAIIIIIFQSIKIENYKIDNAKQLVIWKQKEEKYINDYSLLEKSIEENGYWEKLYAEVTQNFIKYKKENPTKN